MNSEQVATLVRHDIDNDQYAPPAGLLGTALPPEDVEWHIEQLKQALVVPYLQGFELREAAGQIDRDPPAHADLWVVADPGGDYVEWYDPTRGVFGLGVRTAAGVPVSIGVYGDVVGTFIAM